ncbi:MAG: hypothetical protein HOP02_15265 [Methylococcaceae bacterium]|nr:hypothetical protein [Methylococcaceae bacterium]
MRFLIFLGVLYSQSLWSDEILVVMGQAYAIEKISVKQLANIYRRKTIINPTGERWNPINLSSNDPLRIAFAQKIFQQPPDVMEAYWNTQYFQGIMPPYSVNSVEAMLRVLETTPSAIGYILPCHLDGRVTVVLKLTVSDDLAGSCDPQQ